MKGNVLALRGLNLGLSLSGIAKTRCVELYGDHAKRTLQNLLAKNGVIRPLVAGTFLMRVLDAALPVFVCPQPRSVIAASRFRDAFEVRFCTYGANVHNYLLRRRYTGRTLSIY
jgi:hypothetical protein